MHVGQAHELKPEDYDFETMNLQVGTRLQFITHRRVKPVQHFSSLIGYVKDEYIILKIPMENGAPIALTEGERLTIRVFSGVKVCSFACTVERVFARPLIYVHVSFPKSVQGTSLRTAMRVKVDLPAQLAGSGGSQACNIVNLSVTGALIQSKRRLPQDDDTLTLQFVLKPPPDDQEVKVNTRASIRNVNVVQAGDGEVFT